MNQHPDGAPLPTRFTRALALLLAPLLAAACAAESRPRAQPNIVLLVSDDHDPRHLGFLGSELASTPHLDRLAREGTVFTTAHVPMSLCRPSLAALLSGLHPHQSGIYANYMARTGPIGSDPTTLDPDGSLPRRLRDAGYATYVGGKFWEGDARAMGFSHGVARASQESFDTFVRQGQDDLLAFVDAFAGVKPIFVFWSPMLPHLPHDPPQRYLEAVDPARIPIPRQLRRKRRREFVRAERKLLAMEAWLDDGVGELRARLEARGVLRDTLFVFLIDNGWSTARPSKGTAFEIGLRTPIVFAWPGRIPAGVRRDTLVSSLDVYPTLLDYAGTPIPDRAAGRSLRPALERGEPLAPRPSIGALYPVVASGGGKHPERDVLALFLRDGSWKYVLYLRPFTQESSGAAVRGLPGGFPSRPAGDVDLFDLASDPDERSDLAGRPEHAAREARYRQRVFAWWLESGGVPPPAVPRMRQVAAEAASDAP